MKRKILAGSTSVIEHIAIDDNSATDGSGLTLLVYDSAGLAAKYKRTGQATWTTITLATATAGTWTSGGFIESDSGAGGEYELHIPDAVLAAGAVGAVVVIYGATNMPPVRIEYELDAVDYQDGVRAGLTALPNAAADAAGGLPISDAGGLDMDTALAVLTGALTESYAADGATGTLTQILYMIQQSLHEFAISGTTRTVKKLDGSTTAATFTLDDADAPTSTTRAT